MCSSPYCSHSRVIDDRAWTTQAGRQYYNTGTSSITVTNAGTLDTTWAAWNTNSITVSNLTYDPQEVWGVWVDANGRSRRVQREEWHVVASPSPEEVAAAEERRLQRAAELEAQRRLREEAAVRAEELLVSCLNADQRRQLAELGAFQVTAPSGRVYTIHRGYAGNVESQGYRFCIHGPSDLPHADQMLMQKLLLETDEPAFLRIANASPARLAA